MSKTLLLPPLSPSPNAPPRMRPTPLPQTPSVEGPGSLLFPQVFAHLGSRSDPNPGLNLFTGAGRIASLALPFCALFAARGEAVVVVEAANCFNLYRLTEWARRKRLDPADLLDRLRIARSFTPFQLAAILAGIDKEMERYHAARLVVTGLPDCLYDEELSETEASSTFARCRQSLARLAAQATVLAFAEAPMHPVGSRARFAASLGALARRVFEVQHTDPVCFVLLKAPGLLTVSA